MIPFRRCVVLLIVLALMATMAMGCAASREGKLYQSALISKDAVETSYTAIYKASKQGAITQAQLQQAQHVYDGWSIAHNAYVTSLKLNASDAELQIKVAVVTEAAQQLIELAMKWRVFRE